MLRSRFGDAVINLLCGADLFLEAPEILGISQTSVRRMISRGLIQLTRVLRHVLTPFAKIDRLFAK